MTVTDVDASRKWYQDVFGCDVILTNRSNEGDVDILVAGSFILGLRRHPHTDHNERFDEGRVGLDHIAIATASSSELEGWKKRLDELGVVNSGIVTSDLGAHLNFRDPDNIALELFALATEAKT